jgi:hypothetical protein
METTVFVEHQINFKVLHSTSPRASLTLNSSCDKLRTRIHFQTNGKVLTIPGYMDNR